MLKSWLEREIDDLQNQSKRSKMKMDNWQFFRVMLILIPLMFYAMSLSATPPQAVKCAGKVVDGGVFFTCKRCRTAQWQSTRDADWAGRFYCKQCGIKMGDE